jgi:hypothetical protein
VGYVSDPQNLYMNPPSRVHPDSNMLSINVKNHNFLLHKKTTQRLNLSLGPVKSACDQNGENMQRYWLKYIEIQIQKLYLVIPFARQKDILPPMKPYCGAGTISFGSGSAQAMVFVKFRLWYQAGSNYS